MAFYSMLRRASSSVAPLAIRAVGSPRSFHGAISTVMNLHRFHRRSFLPSCHHFSSAAVTAKKPSSDESLIPIIDSEIKCAEESDDHDRIEKTPGGFPFVIQDNPGERTIMLKREYQDEVIRVEVDMPNLGTEEGGDDDDHGGDGDGDDENNNQVSIPLVVSVSKGSGLCLEFGVTAFPDDIVIDSLSIKDPESSEDQIAYEGPDFSDLDENLQKAFQKYLEIRGIKPSTTNFLYEYMINKDSKEYLLWLKKLKNFIEK